MRAEQNVELVFNNPTIVTTIAEHVFIFLKQLHVKLRAATLLVPCLFFLFSSPVWSSAFYNEISSKVTRAGIALFNDEQRTSFKRNWKFESQRKKCSINTTR